MFSCCALLYEPEAFSFLPLSQGTVVGVVIYTGRELRSVMNTSNPKHKVQ